MVKNKLFSLIGNPPYFVCWRRTRFEEPSNIKISSITDLRSFSR